MKTGYGLTTGDSLGYLSHSAKPFSSLPYGGGAGSKGYSSLTSSGLKSAKYGAGGDKDTFGGRAKKTKSRQGCCGTNHLSLFMEMFFFLQ